MSALYIVGAPGTGKTTLLRHYLHHTGHILMPERRLTGQLWAQPLTYHGRITGYCLGRHKPPFSGTDALGMAVMPHALTWLTTNPQGHIYGEGNRLGTPKFLQPLAQHTPLTLIHLHRDDAPQLRHARGTHQNPTWIKTATTQAHNTATTMQRYATVHWLNTTNQTPQQTLHTLTTTLQQRTPK